LRLPRGGALLGFRNLIGGYFAFDYIKKVFGFLIALGGSKRKPHIRGQHTKAPILSFQVKEI
jgi:hypothetical protein